VFEHQFTHRQTVAIPYAELREDPEGILLCLPRVAGRIKGSHGSQRITLRPIQITPLVHVQACGWVQLQIEEDCIRWVPKTCAQSNGCLSGTARPASDGNTEIEAEIHIRHPDLPSMPSFSRWMIERYLVVWAKRFIQEFTTNWCREHS